MVIILPFKHLACLEITILDCDYLWFSWFFGVFWWVLLNFYCLLPMAYLHKYRNTQIQIYRYKYTSTNTQNANTAYQTPVLVGENSSRLRALLGESQGGSGHFFDHDNADDGADAVWCPMDIILPSIIVQMSICQWWGWLGCDRWCGHDEYNETVLKVYYTEEYNGRLCLCSLSIAEHKKY